MMPAIIKCTRFPQTDVSPYYIRNINLAYSYFRQWFLNPREPYKNVLVKMHEIMKRDYFGNTHCSKQFNNIASQFRNEAKPLDTPHLKKEWYDLKNTSRKFSPAVKNIPSAFAHQIVDIGQHYQLFLPNAKHLDYYLAVMERLMTQIRKGVTLQLLANYIHSFIIAHPFEKINNSICMTQVNTILRLNGYPDIFHKYLDFDCFLYAPSRIEEKFIIEVKS